MAEQLAEVVPFLPGQASVMSRAVSWWAASPSCSRSRASPGFTSRTRPKQVVDDGRDRGPGEHALERVIRRPMSWTVLSTTRWTSLSGRRPAAAAWLRPALPADAGRSSSAICSARSPAAGTRSARPRPRPRCRCPRQESPKTSRPKTSGTRGTAARPRRQPGQERAIAPGRPASGRASETGPCCRAGGAGHGRRSTHVVDAAAQGGELAHLVLARHRLEDDHPVQGSGSGRGR